MNGITLKDIIGWGIPIVLAIIGWAILWLKKEGWKNKVKILQDVSQQNHIRADKVIQNNYFINAPKEIKDTINLIYMNTGTTLDIAQKKPEEKKK